MISPTRIAQSRMTGSMAAAPWRIRSLVSKNRVTGWSMAAMGRAIRKTVNVQRHLPEEERAENVVFVVITDGYENDSREYSLSAIKALVEHLKETVRDHLRAAGLTAGAAHVSVP